MTTITLGKFREVTKELPDDYEMNTTIEFGKEWSIRGSINCMHICPLEHTYSNHAHITLTQCESENLVVKKLTDKDTWKTLEGTCLLCSNPVKETIYCSTKCEETDQAIDKVDAMEEI